MAIACLTDVCFPKDGAFDFIADRPRRADIELIVLGPKAAHAILVEGP